MSEKTRKLRVFDQDIDVVDVEFKPVVEHFNEYELGDGSLIKVKAVATSIMRIHNQFTTDGDPIYIVITSPATRVTKSGLKADVPKAPSNL
jgi:hypothetical protein